MHIHRQGTLSLSSGSPPVCTIKILSRCLSETGERALLPIPSSCPTKASGCAQSTQGVPFDHLTLDAKEPGVPALHGNVIISRTVLGRPVPQGTAQRADWNTTFVFLWKKAYSLSVGSVLRFPTHPADNNMLPGNVSRETSSLCTILASLKLSKTSRKEFIHLSGGLIFCNYHPGTPPKLLIWRIMTTDIYIYIL